MVGASGASQEETLGLMPGSWGIEPWNGRNSGIGSLALARALEGRARGTTEGSVSTGGRGIIGGNGMVMRAHAPRNRASRSPSLNGAGTLFGTMTTESSSSYRDENDEKSDTDAVTVATAGSVRDADGNSSKVLTGQGLMPLIPPVPKTAPPLPPTTTTTANSSPSSELTPRNSQAVSTPTPQPQKKMKRKLSKKRPKSLQPPKTLPVQPVADR